MELVGFLPEIPCPQIELCGFRSRCLVRAWVVAVVTSWECRNISPPLSTPRLCYRTLPSMRSLDLCQMNLLYPNVSSALRVISGTISAADVSWAVLPSSHRPVCSPCKLDWLATGGMEGGVGQASASTSEFLETKQNLGKDGSAPCIRRVT
jgi:hypothetical protein